MGKQLTKFPSKSASSFKFYNHLEPPILSKQSTLLLHNNPPPTTRNSFNKEPTLLDSPIQYKPTQNHSQGWQTKYIAYIRHNNRLHDCTKCDIEIYNTIFYSLSSPNKCIIIQAISKMRSSCKDLIIINLRSFWQHLLATYSTTTTFFSIYSHT
jgi:hypothetical protein